MSLTSYRAAPPRANVDPGQEPEMKNGWAGRPGGDLLSRALRRSTMGAGGFHGRVRDGIGCGPPAKATRSSSPSFVGRIQVLACCELEMLRIISMHGNVIELYRAIRTSQLHALPRFHTWPIDVMVYHGPQGDLVSRWVSRLDAFSGYPVRT